MREEEKNRTFNDEQRAIFEQPDDAPAKTRPHKPGESDTDQSNSRDEGGEDSERGV
jgi:hypothetical protein